MEGLTVLQHIKVPSEVGCFNVNSLGGQKTVYYIIKKNSLKYPGDINQQITIQFTLSWSSEKKTAKRMHSIKSNIFVRDDIEINKTETPKQS